MAEAEEELVDVGMNVRDRWKVVKKLGEGGFGAVFEVYDIQTRESCALKVESSKERNQVLKMEVAVLRRLQGKAHVTKFIGCGRNEKFNYVVMALVGKNLADYKRETPDQKFSVSTGIRLTYQCTQSVEDLHNIGFLHRDLKPGNFVMGRPPDHKTCYMLDFGLARQYVNNRGDLRTPRAAAGFRGTVRYASVSAHRNRDMGRYDDLWCLLYMGVEFIAGQLPWRKFSDKDQVGKMKEEIARDVLLQGCPEEMHAMHKHISGLRYESKPDYQLWKDIMNKVLKRYRVMWKDPFDWESGHVVKNPRPFKGPRSGEQRFPGQGEERSIEDVDNPYGVPDTMKRGRG